MIENNIIIKRSNRRKKTIEFRMKEGKLYVYSPSFLSDKELTPFIEQYKEKVKRKEAVKNSDDYLINRANFLKSKFFVENLPEFVLYYSTKLGNGSWGICYPFKKVITLHPKLSTYPEWVLDYVIIHEMAHFIYKDHSKQFWEIVSRYPLKERAIGYLIAKAGEIKEN